MATGLGSSNGTYSYAGYASLVGVEQPTNQDLRNRYAVLEGGKTQGMRQHDSQQSLRRATTSISGYEVGNVQQDTKNPLHNQYLSFSQRNNLSLGLSQGKHQKSVDCSGSNFSIRQTDKQRKTEKPASNPGQGKPPRKSSGSGTEGSGGAIKTESVSRAAIKSHVPRHLTEIEKKTIKLANGLMELRQNTHKGDYKKYLESAVDFMTFVDFESEAFRDTPKQAKITSDDFEELFRLQRAFKGKKKEPAISSEEFNIQRGRLGVLDANSATQVEALVDLLGSLDDTVSILNQYQTGFTHEMQASIKRTVYRNAIDRLSKKYGSMRRKLKNV